MIYNLKQIQQDKKYRLEFAQILYTTIYIQILVNNITMEYIFTLQIWTNSELRIIRILNVHINPAKSFTVDHVFLMNYTEVELLVVRKYSSFPSFYDNCRRSQLPMSRTINVKNIPQ